MNVAYRQLVELNKVDLVDPGLVDSLVEQRNGEGYALVSVCPAFGSVGQVTWLVLHWQKFGEYG